MKKIKNKIKNLTINIFERIIIKKNRISEIRKIKDIRRKSIYKNIFLTKEKIKKIDNIYKQYYGKKIPYNWHKYYTAFTGNFDEKYFPELLYIPEFEHFMNHDKAFANVLENKNILPIFAKQAGIKMPLDIISNEYGIFKDKDKNVITKKEAIKNLKNIGECFFKPSIGTSSGVGCKLLDFTDNKEKKSNMDIEDFIDQVGDNFVIQEKIKCHESIKNIYSKSVNTFRIMTYRWKNEIISCPAIMRIGQGESFLDNAHAGGMFIAIDDDGTLHEEAYTEFKNVYKKHPDSNLVFKNYKIELFPKVIKKVKYFHEKISGVGVINWDMTINEEGEPVLIEANVNQGSIWLFQIAWGNGVFGNKLCDILKWITFMEKQKYEDRKKYLYGRMKDE